MKNRTRIPFQLSAISAMVLAASAVMAQQAETQDSAVEEVYAPLLLATRPLDTRWQTDYAGALQLGLGNTSVE